MVSIPFWVSGARLRASRAAGPGGGLVGFGEGLEVRERRVPGRLEPLAEQTHLPAARGVVAKAPLLAPRDETGGLEDAQVLRDGPEAHVGIGAMDLARRPLPVPDEPQDLAASRGGEGVEDGGHADTLA